MVWPLKHESTLDYDINLSHFIPQQVAAEAASSLLNHNAALDLRADPSLVRHVSIWCNIGKANNTTEKIYQMIMQGATIIRISYSSEPVDRLHQIIRNIREAIHLYCCHVGRYVPIAISTDDFGLSIQLGFIKKNNKVFLPKGHILKLTTDPAYFHNGNKNIIYISQQNIHKLVPVGTRIIIDFGEVVLIITGWLGINIACEVESQGWVVSRVKVHLPGLRVDEPKLSEQDYEAIDFCIKEGLDIFCPSNVECAEDVLEVKKWFKNSKKKIWIVCKIGNLIGVQNIEEIVKEADGVFLGRGYVGNDIGLDKVPLAQKKIIAVSNKYGKPACILGQLVHSTLKYSIARKCDLIDIANVAADGGSMVMTHSETSAGENPIEAVKILHKNLKVGTWGIWNTLRYKNIVKTVKEPTYITDAVAIGAVLASLVSHASAIIAITSSGRTAILLSKYFPQCPIIAVTRCEDTTKKLCMYRGIVPLFYKRKLLYPWHCDVEARVEFAIKFAKETGILKTGELIIIQQSLTQGSTISETMRIMYMSDVVDNIVIGDGDYS